MGQDITSIAVVGTINHDIIYPYQAPASESYGGILYNLIALASCLPEGISLSPICNVGEDVQQDVFQFLARFNNIRRSGIRIVPQKNNRATLRYSSPQDREEFIELNVPSLTIHDIEPCLDCDVILVNFVSGIDMSLEALWHIRKHSSGLVFIDIHSLTLDVADDTRRVPRRVDHWEKWIEPADILQLNRDEARILAGRDVMDDDALLNLARDIHSIGPILVICTLADQGSVLTWKKDDEIIVDRGLPADVQVVDPTGCGDVFSAGFIAEYIRSKDPVAANRFANRVAGINATWRGVEQLHTIGRMLQRSG